MIVCVVTTGLTASTVAATGVPVTTALLAFGIAGVPVAVVELPFAFSFATVDLLCVALRSMKAGVASHHTRQK